MVVQILGYLLSLRVPTFPDRSGGVFSGSFALSSRWELLGPLTGLSIVNTVPYDRHLQHACEYMGVSKNSGTTKSSILIGFSLINHPFWGTPIFGNTHICVCVCVCVLEYKYEIV